MRFYFAPDAGAAPGGPAAPVAGAAVPASTEPAAPAPEIDADALIDGDGIPEGAKFKISATKLRELNEIRKAFRESGVDPAQIPALIQRWQQLEATLGQAQKPAPAADPAKEVSPADQARRDEARHLFHELFPEYQNIPQVIQAMQEMSQRQDAAVRALYMDSHDAVVEALATAGHQLSDEQINDVEDLILNRIRSDPQKAQRYYFGRNGLRVVEQELKSVLGHLGHPARTRAADAALEGAKRRTLATVPPRVQGAVPGPGGPAPPTTDPANPMLSARKNALAFLRAANQKE